MGKGAKALSIVLVLVIVLVFRLFGRAAFKNKDEYDWECP
jgi:hypothetical protein